MIGQTALLKKIDSYTLETCPKTLLFLGEKGSGRQTLINRLCTKFNLDCVHITEETSAEDLISYLQNPIIKVYSIDLSQFSQKNQNKLLKFIEEPSKNCYIMLKAESESQALNTILNRCLILHMLAYSEQELRQVQVYPEPLIYKICTTPGQVLDINYQQMQALYKLANKFVQSLNQATYANTLSIAAKINYKDLYDKFDFDLFFRTVKYAAFEDYLTNKHKNSFIIYQITNKYLQASIDRLILKENFVLKYLTDVWQTLNNKSR